MHINSIKIHKHNKNIIHLLFHYSVADRQIENSRVDNVLWSRLGLKMLIIKFDLVLFLTICHGKWVKLSLVRRFLTHDWRIRKNYTLKIFWRITLKKIESMIQRRTEEENVFCPFMGFYVSSIPKIINGVRWELKVLSAADIYIFLIKASVLKRPARREFSVFSSSILINGDRWVKSFICHRNIFKSKFYSDDWVLSRLTVVWTDYQY